MSGHVRAPFPEAVAWTEDRRGVDILDQTRLPEAEVRLQLRTVDEVVEAIVALRVRGAPALGVAAAMGLAVEMARHEGLGRAGFAERLADTARRIRSARPTAVNPARAIDRLLAAVRGIDEPAGAVQRLGAEAEAIRIEDRAMCQRIGEHGAALFPDGDVAVLTHCNAGALATAGIGTALAPVHHAHRRGRRVRVFATETRPLLQGSRITAWELERAGIEVTVLPDSAAALLMREHRVDLVLVGADRIAANGDVANKVGTYALAVLAAHHAIPFYVAAPLSTLDPATPSGDRIPIEHRDADEVRRGFGRLTAPAAVPVFAPAFDVTPAGLVTAIVTDAGVVRPPYGAGLRSLSAASAP